MSVGSFFKKLGGGVLKSLHLVAQLVTDQQVAVAIQWVRQAAGQQFVDNTRRREFAVARVQSALHIPESLSRYLVELAVQVVKHETDVALKKIEEELSDDDPPSQAVTDLQGKFEELNANYMNVVAELEATKATLAEQNKPQIPKRG